MAGKRSRSRKSIQESENRIPNNQSRSCSLNSLGHASATISTRDIVGQSNRLVDTPLAEFSQAAFEKRMECISKYIKYGMQELGMAVHIFLDDYRGYLTDGYTPASSAQTMYNMFRETHPDAFGIEDEWIKDGHAILEESRKDPEGTCFPERMAIEEPSNAELLLALLLKEFKSYMTGEGIKEAILNGPMALRTFFCDMLDGSSHWRLHFSDSVDQAYRNQMAPHLQHILSPNSEVATFIEHINKDMGVSLVFRVEAVLAPLLTSSVIHWTTDELRLVQWPSHIACWVRRGKRSATLEVFEDFFCGATVDTICREEDSDSTSDDRFLIMASGRVLTISNYAMFLKKVPSSDAAPRKIWSNGKVHHPQLHQLVMLPKQGITMDQLSRLWEDDRISVDHLCRDVRYNDIFSLRLATPSEQALNRSLLCATRGASRFVGIEDLEDDLQASIRAGNLTWLGVRVRSEKFTSKEISEAWRARQALTSRLECLPGLYYCPDLALLRKDNANGRSIYWYIRCVKDVCFSSDNRHQRYPRCHGSTLHQIVGDTLSMQEVAEYVHVDTKTGVANIMVYDHVSSAFDPSDVEEVTQSCNVIRGIGRETIVHVLVKPYSKKFRALRCNSRIECINTIRDHFSAEEFKRDPVAIHICNMSDTKLWRWITAVEIDGMCSSHIHIDEPSTLHSQRSRTKAYKIRPCSGPSRILFGFESLKNYLKKFGIEYRDLTLIYSLGDNHTIRQRLCRDRSNGSLIDITSVFGRILPARTANANCRSRILYQGKRVADVNDERGLMNHLIKILTDANFDDDIIMDFAQDVHKSFLGWSAVDYAAICIGRLRIEKIFEFERAVAGGEMAMCECIGPVALLSQVQMDVHPDIHSIMTIKLLLSNQCEKEFQDRWNECKAYIGHCWSLRRSAVDRHHIRPCIIVNEDFINHLQCSSHNQAYRVKGPNHLGLFCVEYHSDKALNESIKSHSLLGQTEHAFGKLVDIYVTDLRIPLHEKTKNLNLSIRVGWGQSSNCLVYPISKIWFR